MNLHKFAEAEKQLRQALQKNVAAPTGHYYVALALMKQQEFEAAGAEFQISIRNSNDRIAPAHKYLGGIYWRNKQYSRGKIRDTIKDLRSKKD